MHPTYKFLVARLFGSSQLGITDRMLRYLIGGGIATLLYVVLVTLQVELLDFHPVLAICTAFLSTEIFVYLINRLWVYGSSLEHTIAIPRFLIVTALGLTVNTGIMALSVDVLGLWYVWGLVGTTLILPLTNFLLNFHWVFR